MFTFLNQIPPKISRRAVEKESSFVKLKCRAGGKIWKMLLSIKSILEMEIASLEFLTAMEVHLNLFRSLG